MVAFRSHTAPESTFAHTAQREKKNVDLIALKRRLVRLVGRCKTSKSWADILTWIYDQRGPKAISWSVFIIIYSFLCKCKRNENGAFSVTQNYRKCAESELRTEYYRLWFPMQDWQFPQSDESQATKNTHEYSTPYNWLMSEVLRWEWETNAEERMSTTFRWVSLFVRSVVEEYFHSSQFLVISHTLSPNIRLLNAAFYLSCLNNTYRNVKCFMSSEIAIDNYKRKTIRCTCTLLNRENVTCSLQN